MWWISLLLLKNLPWPEFMNELYRSSDCRLSAKIVPTFPDSGCHVVSVTDPYSRILGFLDLITVVTFSILSRIKIN
jgi:hypothetical protein